MAKQKVKTYLINRDKYKAIKKFDHQQMENFCADIYKSGYQDGRDSVPGVDLSAVYEAIGATKGIGPKKLEEIKRSIETAFMKEEKADGKEGM